MRLSELDWYTSDLGISLYIDLISLPKGTINKYQTLVIDMVAEEYKGLYRYLQL